MSISHELMGEIEKIRQDWSGFHRSDSFDYQDYAEWLEVRFAEYRIKHHACITEEQRRKPQWFISEGPCGPILCSAITPEQLSDFDKYREQYKRSMLDVGVSGSFLLGANDLQVKVDPTIPPNEIQLRDRSGRILSRVCNIGRPQLPDYLL